MKDFDFTPELGTVGLPGVTTVPRSLIELEMWKRKPFDVRAAIIDLYLLRNTTQGEHTFPGGMVFAYAAGECLWSNLGLAARWGWRTKSVEELLRLLEKNGFIERRDIGQKRKVIKMLLPFDPNATPPELPIDQQFDLPPDRQNDQQNAPPPDRQMITEGNRVERTSTKEGVERIEGGEGAPPRQVTLAMAIQFCTVNEAGYTTDQIREQWLYYDAMRRASDGAWQRPLGTKGAMVPIADWRSEISRALLQFANGANGSDGIEKKPARSPAQRRFELSKELEAVKERLDACHELGAEPDAADVAREKTLQAELREEAA